jgi:hypothetical protein
MSELNKYYVTERMQVSIKPPSYLRLKIIQKDNNINSLSVFPISVFTTGPCFFWIQLAVFDVCCIAASLMEEKPGGGGAAITTEPEFGDPTT